MTAQAQALNQMRTIPLQNYGSVPKNRAWWPAKNKSHRRVPPSEAILSPEQRRDLATERSCLKDQKTLGYCYHIALISIAQTSVPPKSKENYNEDVLDDKEGEIVLGKAPHELEEGGKASLHKL